ncbi:hypothetical protein [Romboutsia sp. 1001713B170207_170306_H8]|uniref:hypothetical protein n=1 Tax=Romboutsia sp. 1001713B170207_170306_H8 TaxID=2787112 RepID=UPI0018976FBC|nr:hypothetical protein [Romboutsia sp. 1001713B170207_170306_H8]
MSENSFFKPLANGLSCATYEMQPPIYIEVRREVLLHNGIGNPDNPNDFSSIIDNVLVYANDINPPFIRVLSEEVYGGDISASVCPNSPSISIPIMLQGCRVIASGNYTALLSSLSKNVAFNYYNQFVGLDQIVDYLAPNKTLPSPSIFDIDIEFENGIIDDKETTGFTNLIYVYDIPEGQLGFNPNGNGYYFFTVIPKVKIKLKDIHN